MSAGPDPWHALRAHTPARIALGRAGCSLPTAEVLRFGAAHAMARDAVHAALDADALAAALRRDAWAPVVTVHSAAADRAVYLRRPDLGRRLSADSAKQLRSMGAAPARDGESPAAAAAPLEAAAAAAGEAPAAVTAAEAPATAAAADRQPQTAAAREAAAGPATGLRGGLVAVVADGLSAEAAQRHAPALLAALRPRLQALGLDSGTVVVAQQARVALGDEVGALLGAAAVLVLIGERPGLSSPCSLGAYLTWSPSIGRSDAQRNCVSNIGPQGQPCDEAAHRIAWLLEAARRRGGTGVGLKDESPAWQRLPAPYTA